MRQGSWKRQAFAPLPADLCFAFGGITQATIKMGGVAFGASYFG